MKNGKIESVQEAIAQVEKEEASMAEVIREMKTMDDECLLELLSMVGFGPTSRFNDERFRSAVIMESLRRLLNRTAP